MPISAGNELRKTLPELKKHPAPFVIRGNDAAGRMARDERYLFIFGPVI
ncbi:Uncharacterized protein dnm_013740 [Desulfonema magnum]|uniref:Uncharacterized protein n=1 Tax=Desulfonema magnum TaxID=45655 RepID=A0A975BH68_9BACT|nr:Uncharacterized protein dnm_013740 [Desulfonema magnum]